MKLYTEEQVREAIELAREGIRIYRVNEFETEKEFDHSEDYILTSLTPIELPSDEEISEKLSFHADGARWVINRIKQQDNG
jgi:hypothetical protein